MRYINRDSLVFPPGWREKAYRAYQQVKGLPPHERKKSIEKHQFLWREMKEALQQCSYGKCWYCESFVPSVAFGDVDHFRPKNKVEHCPRHPGYYWLAFDPNNFRYTCELCNRPSTDPDTGTTGGKGCAFPLWDETKRCYDETSPGGILSEEPLLLDSVIAADPLLLTFDEEGLAQPAFVKEKSPKRHKRAVTSINIYHLNRSQLKNRRQFFICRKVRQFVAEGDEWLFLLLENDDNRAAQKGYNTVVESLAKMISEQAEYSATARAILKTFRDPDHEWVYDLLAAF